MSLPQMNPFRETLNSKELGASVNNVSALALAQALRCLLLELGLVSWSDWQWRIPVELESKRDESNT